MAQTARKEEEKKEFFDPPEILEEKLEQLAQWIRESKHMITFTVSILQCSYHRILIVWCRVLESVLQLEVRINE